MPNNNMNKAILSLLILGSAISAGATTPTDIRATDLSGLTWQSRRQKIDLPGGARMAQREDANRLIFGSEASGMRRENAYKPDETSSATSGRTGMSMIGPNGETWYYSAKTEYDYIVHNEYYSEPFLKTYSFTIYDSKMKEVGRIYDVMRYAEDEIKVPDIYLVPLVTKNFFNDDDKYEVMVSLAINTPVWGVMHFRNEVYSLGGPKEQKEYKGQTVTVDVPVYTVPGRLGDVLDATRPGEPENYYLTFFQEYINPAPKYPDGYPEGSTDDDINDIYWQHICMSHIDYQVYTSKGDAPEIRKVMERTIMHQKLPGDQESTPPMISLTHGNDVYFMFQEYKETLANPYKEPHIDPNFSIRDANTLIVDLYKVSGNTAAQVNHSEFPFVKDQTDGVFMTTMAVGNLRYDLDIDFDHFNSGDLPAYIVARTNMFMNEATYSSYYVYGPDGTKLKTIFENAESFTEMSPFPGEEEQINFVSKPGGVWHFNFVNLPSCEKVLTQSWLVDMGDDQDPEKITVNMDRAPWGDTYAYAAEMRVPLADDDDNVLWRIMWISKQGKVLAVDEMNLGKNVYYALCYVDAETLNPELFVAGPEREYMMLVKRGIQVGSSKTQEELVIGQARSAENPEGKTILHLSPNDGNGTLSQIYVTPGKNPSLSVTYSKNGRYTRHLYYLPFGVSKVEDIADADETTPIRYDGNAVSAPGETIRIFDLNGTLVAEGADSIDISTIAPRQGSPRLLIVTAGTEVRKIMR